MEKIFNIPDQDDYTPIIETDYFEFLNNNYSNKPVHFFETKLEYLTGLGFVKGQNHLTNDDLQRLKFIEQHFVRLKSEFN